MAAHSNDKTFLGDGLKFNVRSYLLEKVLDFGLMKPIDTSKYYEIGTLPKGFVPRNIAIIELDKASASSTLKVYKTVEDADNGSATEVASLNVGGSTLGFVAKSMQATTVTQSSSSPYAVSGVEIGSLADAQLAVKAGAAFTGGKVKVAISGDMMTGYWNESLENTSGDFDAGDHVRVNTVS